MKSTRLSLVVIFVSVTFLALSTIPGCTEAEFKTQAEQQLVKAENIAKDLQTTLANLKKEESNIQKWIDATPEGELKESMQEKLNWTIAQIEMLQAELPKYEATIAKLRVDIANANNRLDIAQGGVSAAAGVIPQPWGMIFGVVGTGIIGIIRAAQNKSVGKKLVTTMQPVVDKLAGKEAGKLADAQDASVKKLVDDAQGKAEGILGKITAVI
tara:strand:- start:1312 stop:1950 length:639 start_codon:yes stop_codon:yes gene_type:complete